MVGANLIVVQSNLQHADDIVKLVFLVVILAVIAFVLLDILGVWSDIVYYWQKWRNRR